MERKTDEAHDQGAEAIYKRVDLVLQQARLQPEEEVQLLDQLEALYPVIAAPEVLPLIEDRGGPTPSPSSSPPATISTKPRAIVSRPEAANLDFHLLTDLRRWDCRT